MFLMLEMESGKLSCGFDEVFLSVFDEDLYCVSCHLPLREPVLTRCGHRFCRDCLEQYISRFVPYIVLEFLVPFAMRKTWKTVRRYQYSSHICQNCLDFALFMIIAQVASESISRGNN